MNDMEQAQQRRDNSTHRQYRRTMSCGVMYRFVVTAIDPGNRYKIRFGPVDSETEVAEIFARTPNAALTELLKRIE